VVVLDYEIDFPTCTALEWSLYSVGVTRFRRLAMNEDVSWGRHRRPGVLEIPTDDYEATLHRFGRSVWNPTFVRWLSDQVTAVCARLIESNLPLEDPRAARGLDAGAAVRATVDALADLLAFHVFNWALPLEDMESYLTDILGGRDIGRTCLMSLMVPTKPAHLTDFYELVSGAAAHIDIGDWNELAAQSLADEIGHLQAPGLAARALESGAELTGYLMSLGTDEVAHAVSLRHERESAKRSQARLVSRLLLATGGRPEAMGRAEAVAAVCQLAADEEELRRRWQSRSLRNIRRWAETHSLVLDDLVPAECPRPQEVEPGRLLATGENQWIWS
jgi:hypothetical protein